MSKSHLIFIVKEDLKMAINKGNNEQSILLNVSTNTDDAVENIKALEAEINKLQDLKIGASGDDLIKITNQIKDVESAMSKANSTKITPKADNGDLKNTILSLHEMEDLLNHLRDEQKSTKDPLRLKELSKQAGELELKIRDINEPFRNISREISEAEDRLYAMSASGQANTAEFNEMVLKVAELKKVVVDIDTAIDGISTDKFGKFLGVGEQMVGVFGGVSGALQLMGYDATRAEEQMAKLMQLQSIMQGLQSLNQFRKQWTLLIASFKQGKVATESISTISSSTDALSTSMKGATASTTVATGATRIFGVALKAVGIGFIVGALGMLISNIDKVKEYILKLFPALEGLGKWFTKISNAVTDFVGITSDATRALQKLEKMTSIRNQGIERQIELLSAQGGKEKEIYQLRVKQTDEEIKLLNEKAKVNKKLTDEEQQQLIDAHQKKNVLYLEERKRVSDEATERAKELEDKAKEVQQAYNEQLKQLKGYLKDAEKVTYTSNHNQRENELKNIRDKYKEQISLAKKLKQDYQKLVDAQAIEEGVVNKKFDTEYFNFIKNNSQQFLDSFSAEYLSTIEAYNQAKVNSTDEQKKDLDARLNNQLVYLSRLKQLQIGLKNAEDELANGDYSIDDNDSFASQKTKHDAQLQAEKEFMEASLYQQIEAKKLENAELERLYIEGQQRLKELMLDPETNAFEISNLQGLLNAKLASIEENNTAIEDATLEHNRKLKKAEEDNAKAKQKIDKEAQKNREENLRKGADVLGQASTLFAEHTVAHKALAVSEATINTYTSAVSAYKSMASIPVVGPALGAVASGVAIATGLASVQKILSVKVPNAKGDSGSSGNATTPSYSAPIINSTILKSKENGNSNVVNAIENTNTEGQVIKAYITNSELKNNEEKNNFYNSIKY
ncbi:hypothetical protein [Sphingobacterium mizutaii]|uniref:hypothetical protein n=1 Tax=Sphingobacterium mizutaii TaxID=1010 RepID=UPI001BE4D1F4|nr:hypothetical protein [Sphingobacterium mizutaii]